MSFKNFLQEANDQLHLMPRTGSKKKTFDSKHQFDGAVQGTHGVPKKQRGTDGKTYYLVGQKVAAIWDGLESKGIIFEGTLSREKDHKVIADGLKSEATEEFETDDHAIYGYVKSRDNKKLFINVIDPTNSGKYKLEVSRNNGKSNFFEDEDLSPEHVVEIVSRICRHPEEY